MTTVNSNGSVKYTIAPKMFSFADMICGLLSSRNYAPSLAVLVHILTLRGLAGVSLQPFKALFLNMALGITCSPQLLLRALPLRALPLRALPLRALPLRALPLRALPLRALPLRAVWRLAERL
jgi:hypothetical protein